MNAEVRSAVAHLDAPFSVLDLDAALANAADMTRRAAGTPIRLASKSLRIRGLIEKVLELPGFSGILSFHLDEALWLVDEGTCTDILVAYPCANRAALTRWIGNDTYRSAVTLMIDSLEHLSLIDDLVTVHRPSTPLRVCLDIDASLKLGPVQLGALRSPIHTPRQAARLTREILRRDYLNLVGVMAYEGQIAGTADSSQAIRLMKKASARELATRRGRIVAAIRDEGATLEFVNGGGTGSIESTRAEDAVTEIGAGSGIIGSALFDGYDAFHPTPAAWFVLPVVRRPNKKTVTVAGGGRIASGPPGKDRLPVVDWPHGLKMSPLEGPGEVQTPLIGKAAGSLELGDHVWFRASKAGEPNEFANDTVVVSGGKVIDVWPTYRGELRSFV